MPKRTPPADPARWTLSKRTHDARPLDLTSPRTRLKHMVHACRMLMCYPGSRCNRGKLSKSRAYQTILQR
jgi:hypothetical protein